jgi:hypothetical protein
MNIKNEIILKMSFRMPNTLTLLKMDQIKIFI